MRFFNASGTLAKAPRSRSSSTDLISADDVREPDQVAQLLSEAMKRITELEAKAPPPSVEFEVVCSAAPATVSMYHGFSGAIRWWVTAWRASASADHGLTEANPTDNGVLTLLCGVSGRAIIRIESAQAAPGR